MDNATIRRHLGGARALETPIRSELDWIAAIERGFSPAAIDAAIEGGLLSREESDRIVIPRRTLQHRQQKGERLSRDESDRLLRVARIQALAEETFADPEKAHRWLRKPNRVLRGEVPLELLRTGAGADLVEEELMRIRYGMYV
jgi:putative toxin-antitoxin system antitoxin component (TIGR02293 family)